MRLPRLFVPLVVACFLVTGSVVYGHSGPGLPALPVNPGMMPYVCLETAGAMLLVPQPVVEGGLIAGALVPGLIGAETTPWVANHGVSGSSLSPLMVPVLDEMYCDNVGMPNIRNVEGTTPVVDLAEIRVVDLPEVPLIGEDCIYNLKGSAVVLTDNGAALLTGNENYKSDLMTVVTQGLSAFIIETGEVPFDLDGETNDMFRFLDGDKVDGGILSDGSDGSEWPVPRLLGPADRFVKMNRRTSSLPESVLLAEFRDMDIYELPQRIIELPPFTRPRDLFSHRRSDSCPPIAGVNSGILPIFNGLLK